MKGWISQTKAIQAASGKCYVTNFLVRSSTFMSHTIHHFHFHTTTKCCFLWHYCTVLYVRWEEGVALAGSDKTQPSRAAPSAPTKPRPLEAGSPFWARPSVLLSDANFTSNYAVTGGAGVLRFTCPKQLWV